MKKMKKAEEDYKSLLVHYKEAKCEIETLSGELTETYSKIKFLELEVVQANAKVKRVSIKKLNDVLSHKKSFSDKTGLGYTRESSLAMNIFKKVKFVKAKEPIVVTPNVEKPKGNLFQGHKEVRERTMFVTIVDFKGTPDRIVIS